MSFPIRSASYAGKALTIENRIGFAGTVRSIPLLAWPGLETGWRWAFTSPAAALIHGAWAISRLKQLA